MSEVPKFIPEEFHHQESDKTEKRTWQERFRERIKNLPRMARVFLLGSMAALNGLPAVSFAEVFCSSNKDKSHFQLVWNDKGTGQKDILEAVPFKELGRNKEWQPDTSLSNDSYLFKNLTGDNQRIIGVNYEIEDQEKLMAFIKQEVEKIVPKDKRSSLLEMDSQLLILLATKIVENHLSYENRMNPENKRYNKKIDQQISDTPLDEVLYRRKGVCRQYAVLVEEVCLVLKDLYPSPNLRNVGVHSVDDTELNHAYNSICEVGIDGSDGMEKTRISFVDATFQDNGDKLEAGDEYHAGGLKSKLISSKQLFTPEEEIGILKGLREYYGDHQQQVVSIEKTLLTKRYLLASSQENNVEEIRTMQQIIQEALANKYDFKANKTEFSGLYGRSIRLLIEENRQPEAEAMVKEATSLGIENVEAIWASTLIYKIGKKEVLTEDDYKEGERLSLEALKKGFESPIVYWIHRVWDNEGLRLKYRHILEDYQEQNRRLKSAKQSQK